MRLRHGLPALWRSRSSFQIGHGAALALVVEQASDVEHDIAGALERPQTIADLRRRARAAGRPEALADQLVDTLREAGALAADEDSAGTHMPARARRRLQPDATAWALLRPDGLGWAHLAQRRGATVALPDLGAVGLGLARVLARAGIGRLALTDIRLVAPQDDALGTYRPTDVGTQRAAAVARMLRDDVPDVAITRDADGADLTVLIDEDVADPVRARELMRLDADHLCVTVRVTDVTIGPLVRPGATPCLHCINLARSEADPSWAALATQLRVRSRSAQPGLEALLSHTVVGLAAAQVLASIDGLHAAADGATLDVALPELIPHRRAYPTHPDCGCVDPGRALTTEPHCA